MKTKTVLILLFLCITSFLRGEVAHLSPQGVDLVTGQYVESNDDITLKGPVPFTLRRIFGSSIERPYTLGGGWQWEVTALPSKLYPLQVAAENNSLTKISLPSKVTGRLFGELHFKYIDNQLIVSDQRERTWQFFFGKEGQLEKVLSPGGAVIVYEYEAEQIVKRSTDEGHVAINELYVVGSNSVGGETLTLAAGDFRIGRVKSQKALIERGGTLQLIAEYLYDPNETTLLEPNGKRTTYFYDANGNILQIQNGSSKHYYTWEKERLVKNVLVDEKETPLVQQEFTYNDEGQLITETLSGNLTGESEWEQYTTERVYSDGLLIQQEDNAGNWVFYTYDPKTSLLSQKEDPTGRTTFTYSEEGLLEGSVKEKISGEQEGIHLDLNEEGLPSVIDESNKTTLLTYDEFGEVVRKESALEGILFTESRTLDARGRELFRDENGKNVVATSYAPCEFSEINYTTGEESLSTLNYQNQVIHKKVKRPSGQILEQHLRYDIQGNLVAKTDVVGNTTEYVWDSLGRIIEKIDPPVLNAEDDLYRPTTRYSYNALNHLTEIIHPDGTTTRYKTNCRGQPLAIHYADGTVQTFAYTLDGKERGEKNIPLKLSVTTDPETGEITHTHKLKKGALKTTWSEEGRTTRDERGHLLVKEEKKSIEEFSYEGGVLQKTEMQPTGLSLTTTYDALGRAEKLTLKDVGQNILSYREFRYDAMGRTVKRVDNGLQETRWVYNEKGELIQTIEYANSDQPRVTEFSYNDNHQLIATRKPDGVSLLYTYNEKGEPTHLTSSDRTVDDEYIYNETGQVVVMIDHLHGRTVERSYNKEGQLLKEIQSFGHKISYRFDSDGKRIELTLPDSSFIRYEYDGARLKKISRPTYEESFTRYDERGYPSIRTLPAGLGELITERNGEGLLTTVSCPYWEERIEYKNSLITNIRFKTPAGVDSHTFSFDDLGQLTSDNDKSFTFDALSNLQQSGDKIFATNAQHQVETDGNSDYLYDKNGNRIAKGNTRYVYDALNRLCDVFVEDHHVHYEYDPLGRRVLRAVDGEEETFCYDEEREIGSYNKEGVPTSLRIMTPAELGGTVAIEVAGKLYIPIHDHRGTICSLIDAKTKTVAEYSLYDPFGEETLLSKEGKPLKESIHPWHFSGKRKDPLTGLIHFGKRDYDPEIGRFIATDPIGSFEGPNPYAYGLNNPLQYVDLNGLYSISTIGESLYNTFTDYLGRLLNQVETASHKVFGSFFLHLAGVYPNPPKVGVFGNGTEPQERYRVTFVNGILSTKEDIAFNLSLISSHHGGHNVHYFYIGTEGCTRDFIRSFYARLGIKTEGVEELVVLWRRLIEEMGGPESGGIIYHYAHSLGGTITQNARYFLTPEEQRMIRVITMGSPTLIADEGFDSVVNIVSHRDPVARIFSGLNQYLLDNIYWVSSPRYVDHTFDHYWDFWQEIRPGLPHWTHEWQL